MCSWFPLATPRSLPHSVLRVVIDGYTQAEAGQQLGLSEPAARKRFQRALKRLRDHAEQKS